MIGGKRLSDDRGIPNNNGYFPIRRRSIRRTETTDREPKKRSPTTQKSRVLRDCP